MYQTRDGYDITCHHSQHYNPADGLPTCHDGREGRRCEGETVQCGKGCAPCQRHLDRLARPVAKPEPVYIVAVYTGATRTAIPCKGPNEAAQLALTLACDGWEIALDGEVLDYITEPRNFDPHNAAIITRAVTRRP